MKGSQFKNEIERLTRAGFSQKEICAALKLHRNRVFYWQKQLGLAGDRPGLRRPPLPENRIVAALRRGRKSRGEIAKQFNTSISRVRHLAEKKGIKRRPSISPTILPKIDLEIIAKLNYMQDISHKYRVSYKSIRKRAREILKCEKFIGSAVWPPMQSAFPQKYFPKGVTTFDELASAILSSLPCGSPAAEFPAELADAMIQVNPLLHSAPLMVRKCFELELLKSLRTQILQNAQAEAAGRWVN